MEMPPSELLRQFAMAIEAGEIDYRDIQAEGRVLIGYVFVARPWALVFTPYAALQPILTRTLLAKLGEESEELVLLFGNSDGPSRARINALTEEERRCWELREKKLPIREIAYEVGRSPSTVKRRLSSAQRKLLSFTAGT